MKEHKKEKAEAHLYTVIKVVRDGDLREQIGRGVYFDLVDLEKVRSFRIHIQLPFLMFKEKVAKEFGIPVQFQRFWLWARRQNHTYRPHRPLTPQEEAQFVGQLSAERNKLHVFLEVELGQNLRPLPPPDKTNKDILLFFKLYDPEKEEFRYVGRLFVKALGKPSDILLKLNEMAGFRPDEEIELFEEIRYEPSVMCLHIDKKLTFQSSELEDGDIICYQKSPAPGSEEQYRYPDVPSFFGSIHIQQPDNASSDEEAASTQSEEVEAHGVKVTVEGDASIPQEEDPAKGGEATSTVDQTLVREALASDILVNATEAVAQESAQGDGGEISVEPSTTTPVLQGEQGSVAPLVSSARPPALTSMSSAGIKSELPKRRADLSIDRIQDIVVKADAAGCANLTDQLISLYTLVEDLHSSQREVPLTALAELQKAQEVAAQYRTEQEIDKSLVAGEHKVAAPNTVFLIVPPTLFMSSAGVSTSHSIKSELPKRLVDLSIEQIQDIIVKSDAAGLANLSDQLIPLYAMVEDLHSSQREVPLNAFAKLQKAQEVAAQYRTEQEEMDMSLVAGEHKVAALESILTWAKGEVRELKRRRLALTPPAPQVIQTLRREAIKQETLNRISRAKVEMLEVEYDKLLLSLE